ncbi:hypothetical protein K501DRAFT_287536 [Backusella circina FSU 941]|nr:hypothetical protein K501DRAFT_287536 [Backusella circina FSU 941]
MTNNTKDKSGSKFWKKLGLGKSKKSMSSLRSEPALGTKENDTLSVKRKSMIKRQSTDHHVSLPKVDADLNQQFIKHVECKVSSAENNKKRTDPIDISTPTKVNNISNNNEKEQEDAIIEKKPPVPQPQESKNVNNREHREPVPSSADDDKQQIITKLKEQLEHEKATVYALQNQKQAITKDLDYLHLTVETLENEKTDLIQQLEDEKVKNLQQTEDLNLMLEKMKSTADNARDKSFAMDHVKSELEIIQTQAKQEKEKLQVEIQSQKESIVSLKYEVDQSHEYAKSLQNTIDQLIKSHAAEISRLATEKSTFHTPNGSPRIESHHDDDDNMSTSSSQEQQQEDEEYYEEDNKENTQADDLDDQLMKLTKEKERLQSFYSKIPLSGGGHQSRRRKEELESMLDQVDSKLSKVKQKIKRT